MQTLPGRVNNYMVILSHSLLYQSPKKDLRSSDPVFPDRTAGVPQYDVNNKAMPDGLEVTARHFYRTNPLSHRCAMPTPSVKT